MTGREFDSAYWLGRMVGHLEWVLEDMAVAGVTVTSAGPAEMTLEEYRQARGSYLAEKQDAVVLAAQDRILRGA